MLRVTSWLLCALISALISGACFADEPPSPQNFYKLDFVVKEVDGTKVLNSRAYWTIVSTGSSGCEIRVQSRVPVQNNVYDVGTSIDCRQVKETDGGLALIVIASISSLGQEPPPGSAFPVTRSNRWNSTVVVPLRKPIVIFSSDDVTSKHQMQLELTATPVK